jgi:molybdate transport system substrate-binding protein
MTGVLAILLSGCRAASGSPAIVVDPPPSHVELTVFGAASLQSALDAVTAAYQRVDQTVSLVVSTDSSAALETKIEQGAPADVFLSADTTNPQKLIDGGYASGSVVPFAGNQLTVIVPKDNPASIDTPAALARAGVDIIAAGDEVPITSYANRLVANLARQPGYPSDFAARYAANVVSKEDNVKAVVGKIELGQGDVGIVYVTDAASRQVRTIDVPPDANVPATYGGVVVKASSHQAAARAFLAWLAGLDGQAILSRVGFLSPQP